MRFVTVPTALAIVLCGCGMSSSSNCDSTSTRLFSSRVEALDKAFHQHESIGALESFLQNARSTNIQCVRSRTLSAANFAEYVLSLLKEDVDGAAINIQLKRYAQVRRSVDRFTSLAQLIKMGKTVGPWEDVSKYVTEHEDLVRRYDDLISRKGYPRAGVDAEEALSTQ